MWSACRWKLLAPVFFLVCGWLASAMAAEPGARERGEGWARRVWQTEDGLPAANVTGIAQTRDGFLWLATQSGLARFDGAHFEEIPIPIGRARPIIRVMLCDHAENFWLAEDGGVVVRFGAALSRATAMQLLAPGAHGGAAPLPGVRPGDITFASNQVRIRLPRDPLRGWTLTQAVVARLVAAAGSGEASPA